MLVPGLVSSRSLRVFVRVIVFNGVVIVYGREKRDLLMGALQLLVGLVPGVSSPKFGQGDRRFLRLMFPEIVDTE
jgi:hypothetical protein